MGIVQLLSSRKVKGRAKQKVPHRGRRIQPSLANQVQTWKGDPQFLHTIRQPDCAYSYRPSRAVLIGSASSAKPQQHQLQPCITETLRYIQDELDAPLPADILARLNAPRASSPVQTQISAEFGKLMIWPKLTRLWSNYLDDTGQLNLGQRIYYFPQYLQYFWHLECLRQVPLKAISATMHHLR
jgi:hypothetical protein